MPTWTPPTLPTLSQQLGKLRVDRWAGDDEAPKLRAALKRGDRTPLVEAYAAADGVRREFLVDVLTSDVGALKAITTWPEEESESALAWLMRGSQRINDAWAVRSSRTASEVSEKAFDRFHAHLRDAESDLRESLRLNEDGTAWSQLLTSGRGLQLTLDELRARYARAMQACPTLVDAPASLLQAFCQKWLGSHPAMFEFARETVATLPVGDPRHRLIAIAYVERAVEFDYRMQRQEYCAEPQRRAELLAAAERSALLPSYGSSPQERVTLNWFAGAMSMYGAAEEARPIFDRIGRRHSHQPWSYFPEGTFLTFRRASRR